MDTFNRNPSIGEVPIEVLVKEALEDVSNRLLVEELSPFEK
jgi:hypothetical protein